MDTGVLSLSESFPTRYVYENDDPSSSDENNKGFFNEWEDERELNGDIALIPSRGFCESLTDMPDLTDSPPSFLYQKMGGEWSFIFIDGVDTLPEDTISDPLPEETFDQKFESNAEYTSDLNTIFDCKDVNNFDLTAYINESSMKNEKRQVKSKGKKIDKEACKYIIEDKNDKLDTSDEIDVETIFEGASLPVLEANDAFSLLEQFEASEKPILPIKSESFTDLEYSNSLSSLDKIPTSPIEIFEKVPQAPIDIFEDDIKIETSLIKIEPMVIEESEKRESPPIENIKIEVEETKIKQEAESKPQTSTSDSTSQTYVKNKQILEALPQELIARINESGKRKTITVIPPIPNKKRAASRSVDNASLHRNKIPKISPNKEQIKLDHDYCVSPSLYPKEPSKDSGFQSSEEEDRSVIRNQPTVKTADGKLMVSLLKLNTIRDINQKKKLNLEEYKKRRFINSNATSQSSSPLSSTCSSPLPEDENLKRLKHQEKLMKMAADLLNTPAKSAKESVVLPKPVQASQVPPRELPPQLPERIVPPPDLEVKTFVSIATNTDISSINSSKSIIASAQQLEEIKPLLKKVSDKINSNSFITSLIENIPKAKTKISTQYVKSEDQEVVREDKIIHYLKKDREPVKTSSVGSQTDFDEEKDEETQSRYRRRIERSPSSSSSSSSSRSSRRSRRRASSNSSRNSRSSRSSDSSSSSTSSRSSRSRSRSLSPKTQRRQSAERLREVEERRVIYVGRISRGTTKEDLRRRFISFGPITNVSLHFREYGDNYGFVTFVNKEHAYDAFEHGNDHGYPKYEICFGGRRIFCQRSYSDLDNVREDDYSYYAPRVPESTFDALLRETQEKIRKRKP